MTAIIAAFVIGFISGAGLAFCFVALCDWLREL
jgi:hypothetical protein